jgi:DNA-binding NarL/FixJ family response regulator
VVDNASGGSVNGVGECAIGERVNGVGECALTRREAEVASLVAQGLSNKTVAGQLGLQEGTVKIHLYSIYRKLGVSGRAQLILDALRRERSVIGPSVSASPNT